MRISKRLTTTLVAISAAALFGAACGDDDGGSPDANTTPDGAPADAAPADAPTVTQTKSGTIALTEVRLLTNDPTTNASLIGGAAVSISFDDVTTGEGIVRDPPELIGCTVIEYDCDKGGCPLPTKVDVGPVTISNPNAETPGLLGPAPLQCSTIAGAYRCPVGNFTALEGTVARAANQLQLTFPGQTFNTNLRGTFVTASGFAGPFAGLNGQALPVVRVASAESLVLGVPGGDIASTAITGIGLTFLQGIGPVPFGAAGSPLGAIDFLTDSTPATETVRIQRAANAEAGYPTALDVTVGPAGEGFVLAEECAAAPPQAPGVCITPTSFPTEVPAGAATDIGVKFSCGATGGSCGPNGMGSFPGAFILSGTASNGSTADVRPFEMPKTDVTKVVSFSCNAIGPQISIPNSVISQVLAIDPTRIESRVLRVAAATVEEPTTKNVTRIAVGHGFVGYTDVPQGKAAAR
jgi:hypothetical protein